MGHLDADRAAIAARVTYTTVEIFAILLSIPASIVAGTIYCFLLAKFVAPAEAVSLAVWKLSAAVLALLAVEIALLLTIGTTRSAAIIGPAFYVIHVILVLHGTPAVANILVLWPPRGLVRWYWAVPICTLCAFFLIIMQYSVSETLYGID